MTKLTTFGRGHPVVTVLIGLLVIGTGGVAYAAMQMAEKFAPVEVDFAVPDAPRLTAEGADQTVYRIDASRSSVTYEVEESLAGVTHHATGTTHGIAGDVLLDDADPAASRVGEVVVNVLQLTSDKTMRDNRIRHEFLQSEEHPLATYAPSGLDGMPATIVDGTDYDVTIHGDLTVKTTTLPVDLAATARRDGDELHVTASTTVRLSDFDVGPIRIIGLVSTADEATLTFDLVAVDEDVYQAPEQVDPAAPEYATGGPSFAETVQPVIETSCATCHEPDAAGSAEWTVATAADVADHASSLSVITQSGYMPPWPASDVGIPLQHDLSLSDEDLAAIKAWADAGGPLDVDPDTPIEAVHPEWATPRHDQRITLPEPYQTSSDLPNDYRCFLLDPGFTEPTAVTGYEFAPDQVELVHHALVYRLAGDQRGAIAEADDADPGPGWQCFGGINVGGPGVSPSGRGNGSELMMGYAPGQSPERFTDGDAMVFQPGDVFVVQMHYHTTHESEPDQTSFFLELGDGDPADYRPISVTTYVAPAEIPCFPEDADEPLCDRAAIIDVLHDEYGPAGPFIANGIHFLCDTAPADLAHLDEEGVARASCDHTIYRDAHVLSVLGHMHEIGQHYRMTLNPGTPDEKILLDIPRWDFDWQFNYTPVESIDLRRGDVLRIECSWDRNLVAEGAEPRYITWAEGTEDEMCFSTMATVPLDE